MFTCDFTFDCRVQLSHFDRCAVPDSLMAVFATGEMALMCVICWLVTRISGPE